MKLMYFMCLLVIANDSDAFTNNDKVKPSELSIGDKVAALSDDLCSVISSHVGGNAK